MNACEPAGSRLRRSLLAALTLGALAAAVAWPPAARGQADPPLPCGVAFDRSVAPLAIHTDETVRVTITATGGTSGACEGTSRAADVFFVVDASITMFDFGLIGPTRDALSEFVNQMDFRTSKAGLITYAAEESIKVNLSADRERLLTSIRAIRKEQENDVRGLSSALRVATQKLDNDGAPGNEKMVIVIIAGPDIGNQLVNLPTVTQAAKNAGVKFAFLLWFESRPGEPRFEARYSHYVEAASFCADTDLQCPNWTLGRRWAWPVALEDLPTYSWDESMKTTMRVLIERLLRPLQVTEVELYEAMSSGADFQAASAVPPPTGGTLRDVVWSFPNIPAGGISVRYDARMVFTDAKYPVTDHTNITVRYSDGSSFRRDLPNPEVDVTGAPTRTPPPTGVPTTAVPSATPTTPAVPTTPAPSATPTKQLPLPTTPAPPEGMVFLPLLVRDAVWARP